MVSGEWVHDGDGPGDAGAYLLELSPIDNDYPQSNHIHSISRPVYFHMELHYVHNHRLEWHHISYTEVSTNERMGIHSCQVEHTTFSYTDPILHPVVLRHLFGQRDSRCMTYHYLICQCKTLRD